MNRSTDSEAASTLVERALHLRMYGDAAPGSEGETWARWDRDAEGFLRDRLCAERGHDPEGRCCPAWFAAMPR